MKTTHNKKITAYKKRIASVIKSIYDLTTFEPFTDGFARYSKNVLFRDCGSILTKLGFVDNEGSKTHPSYRWVGEEPGKSLYNKVYNVLQDRKDKNTKKTGKKNLIPVVEEVYPVTGPLSPSVLALVNFTDQQLWDELKKRNYAIIDNRLCQVTYLQ